MFHNVSWNIPSVVSLSSFLFSHHYSLFSASNNMLHHRRHRARHHHHHRLPSPLTKRITPPAISTFKNPSRQPTKLTASMSLSLACDHRHKHLNIQRKKKTHMFVIRSPKTTPRASRGIC